MPEQIRLSELPKTPHKTPPEHAQKFNKKPENAAPSLFFGVSPPSIFLLFPPLKFLFVALSFSIAVLFYLNNGLLLFHEISCG